MGREIFLPANFPATTPRIGAEVIWEEGIGLVMSAVFVSLAVRWNGQADAESSESTALSAAPPTL